MTPPQDEGPTDTGLMDALASGNDHALDPLMERWAPRVHAFLLRMTGNPTLAADLAQETFVRLFLRRSSWNKGSAFQPWILQIAANLARNHVRWSSRHPSDSGDSLDTLPDHSADPATAAELADRASAVRSAVLALPPELREAIILTTYEGLTHQEAAAAAATSPKTIEHRVRRARDLLRRSLAPWIAEPSP
ncbi:MAG: RNA polymerase sigma factor [Verrucomicrobiota bacterium]